MVNLTPFWIPKISMTFSSVDEAWNFWVTYGGRMGFDVRKYYANKSGLDGLVTTCRFVYSNQGEYTPVIFEAFQGEYEKSRAAYIVDSDRST